MLDQGVIQIDEFNGIFAHFDENIVPPGHFKDALNLSFGFGSVDSRVGIERLYTLPDIRRVRTFKIPGGTDRLLILNGSGNLYDSTNLVTPILSIPTMTDFALANIFDRAYISPHNGVTGLDNEVVYVYDGTNPVRPAAGEPPQGFDLTLTSIAPTVKDADVVAPVAPANGAQTLTTSPYVPPTASTLRFNQAGGTVTAITITVVGVDSGGDPLTKIYVNKIASAGPANYITGEVWRKITSITISALAGAGGLFKVEVTGLPTGKVEQGYHVVALAYETTSGFITKPGPLNNFEAIRIKKKNWALKIEGIPAAPGAQIAKIHILVSKSIARKRYTGDPEGYELFFVPKSFGGEVQIGETEATVNFFDADLVDSADYLLDTLSSIPAMVTLAPTSRGRLLGGGEFDSPTTLRGSKGGEPENFSSTDGFVIVKPGDAGGGVKNLCEYRDLIFVYKSNRSYVTEDTGDKLSTWDINTVDNAIGAEPNGISRVFEAEADTFDTILVADRGGLQAFTGTYAERELSWKIKDLWEAITKGNFDKVNIAVDPISRHIFVSVPTDTATTPNNIFFADYSNGLDWQNIKWMVWSFGAVRPTSVLTEIDPVTRYPGMKFGSIDGNIYRYEAANPASPRNDDGVAINAYWETYKSSFIDTGGSSHISGAKLKIQGSGKLSFSFIGAEGSPVFGPEELQMNESGRNAIIRSNIISDFVSLRGEIDGLNEYMTLKKIWLYGTEQWGERSSLLDYDLLDGLVSAWELDEVSGTRFDSHGTNNLAPFNAPGSSPGIGGVGTALQLVQSSSQSISILTPPVGLRLAGDRSMTCFFYLDSILSDRDALIGAGASFYSLEVDQFGKIGFIYWDDLLVSHGVEVPTVLSTARWYFVYAEYDSVNLASSIQLDDNAIITTVHGVTARSGAPVEFWMGERNGTHFANGRIAQGRFWNRKLLPIEREKLRNRGAGLPYSEFGAT